MKADRTPKRAAEPMPETVSWWVSFYRVVRRIPPGRVCTYGVVAALGGRPRAARHVGYALAALKDGGPHGDVPWHRVLGSRPRNRAAVSLKDPVGGAIQRAMLEKEGVAFDARGNVDLGRFGWEGPDRETARARGRKGKTTTRQQPGGFTTEARRTRRNP
jgi:methylated-DNA-protein-cysteine methyltransferase related protein